MIFFFGSCSYGLLNSLDNGYNVFGLVGIMDDGDV